MKSLWKKNWLFKFFFIFLLRIPSWTSLSDPNKNRPDPQHRSPPCSCCYIWALRHFLGHAPLRLCREKGRKCLVLHINVHNKPDTYMEVRNSLRWDQPLIQRRDFWCNYFYYYETASRLESDGGRAVDLHSFLRIRIQQFFSMRIQIQLLFYADPALKNL